MPVYRRPPAPGVSSSPRGADNTLIIFLLVFEQARRAPSGTVMRAQARPRVAAAIAATETPRRASAGIGPRARANMVSACDVRMRETEVEPPSSRTHLPAGPQARHAGFTTTLRAPQAAAPELAKMPMYVAALPLLRP
jgi:hypothetical protein